MSKWKWAAVQPEYPNVVGDHSGAYWLADENGDPILQYYGCGSHSVQVLPEHRALIAAAPDLLAACEGLLDVLALPYEEQCKRIEAAERAVAKARGE